MASKVAAAAAAAAAEMAAAVGPAAAMKCGQALHQRLSGRHALGLLSAAPPQHCMRSDTVLHSWLMLLRAMLLMHLHQKAVTSTLQVVVLTTMNALCLAALMHPMHQQDQRAAACSGRALAGHKVQVISAHSSSRSSTNSSSSSSSSSRSGSMIRHLQLPSNVQAAHKAPVVASWHLPSCSHPPGTQQLTCQALKHSYKLAWRVFWRRPAVSLSTKAAPGRWWQLEVQLMMLLTANDQETPLELLKAAVMMMHHQLLRTAMPVRVLSVAEVAAEQSLVWPGSRSSSNGSTRSSKGAGLAAGTELIT